KVELFQFMCHQFLSVDFGPRINFVIGHNGSGKSAILTGIMVCLGGKAKSTDRASSLKSLVMEGKTAAEVTVAIHNKGPEAYKPEVYGQTIIIARKISKDGTSGYRILDADGVTQAHKKEDLLAILDHMSIAIDNPLSILTQDTSRQFLANSTPQSKYEFFSKGTLLAQLSLDHALIEECVSQADEVQKFQDLENEIAELKRHYAWSIVEEKEKARTSKKERAAHLDRKCLDRRNRVQEVDVCISFPTPSPSLPLLTWTTQDAIAIQKERIDVLTQSMQTLVEEGQPLHARFDKARTLMLELRDQKAGFDADVRDAGDKMMCAQQARDSMVTRIEEEARKLGAVDRCVLFVLTEEIEAAERTRRHAETRSSDAERQVRSIEGDLKQMRDDLRNLERRGYDRLSAYGVDMQQLLRAIQNERWIGHKPVGPLGMHVSLKEPSFKLPIEANLGKTLRSFVVDNAHDREKLKGLLIRFRCNFFPELPALNHGSNNQFGPEESDQNDEAYSTLVKEARIARNQLVIHNHIEKVALVRTKHEGDDLATSGRGRGMPADLDVVYTIDNVAIGGRGGGFQTKAGQDRLKGMPLLGVDLTSFLISDRQARIDRAMRELEKFKEVHTLANSHFREASEKYERLRRERTSAVSRKQQLDYDIKRLQEDLVEEEPGPIGLYEEKKREAEEEMEGYEKQIRDIRESIEKVEEQIQNLNSEMNQLKRELDAIKSQHEAKKVCFRAENAQLLRRKEEESGRLAELEQAVPLLRDEVAALEEDVLESTRVALEVTDGERLDPKNTSPDVFKRKIRTLEMKLQENLTISTGTRDHVAKILKEAEVAFREAKAECEAIESLITLLKESLDARLDDWKRLRKTITVKAKNTFTMMMEKRGFHAQLIINHQAQTLDLRVDVHNQGLSQAKDKDKDPKTLSGGEKSFSTVCLLLSLWESMGNPFRALDEFDVFMDAVNRKISMTNMIQYARSGTQPCQYIFITPQDMSHVPDLNGRDVKVHRLRDPERNQGRLNFERD
ncbi:P-loop containing nucleoside triphosphate hydrolase protein, partial [Chytriomyces sp. MP71]